MIRDPYEEILADCPAVEDACRFAVSDDGHECIRRDGEPLGDHGVCFSESRAQIRDARRSQGLPDEPSATVIRTVADIIRPVIERQARTEGAA